jgi:hypothetical protein
MDNKARKIDQGSSKGKKKRVRAMDDALVWW